MKNRARRLRISENMRELVKECSLSKRDLIYPLFIIEGEKIKKEIGAMDGQYQLSIDMLDDEIKELRDLGIRAVILFGIPEHKDSEGSESFNEHGVIQEAVRKIKSIDRDMIVICDLCLCEYTDHGHCGIIVDGYVDNDETLKRLEKAAVSQARAGADIIAPSDMMDGRVKRIRKALDKEGFVNVSILSYSAKYASNFYGPFRAAAASAPKFGDRKTYQMDYRNIREAKKEILQDIKEGADMIMVKPAMSYLDVMRMARDISDIPLIAYSVSGEYQMLKRAVKEGFVNEDIIMEVHLSMKRAGAYAIITYFAKELAGVLK